MRRPYAIATTAVKADRDIEVSIQGPGLSPGGQRFAFANSERARRFVDALNMAYAEGVKEGFETASLQFSMKSGQQFRAKVDASEG